VPHEGDEGDATAVLLVAGHVGATARCRASFPGPRAGDHPPARA
jgi:hypothetical protein